MAVVGPSCQPSGARGYRGKPRIWVFDKSAICQCDRDDNPLLTSNGGLGIGMGQITFGHAAVRDLASEACGSNDGAHLPLAMFPVMVRMSPAIE